MKKIVITILILCLSVVTFSQRLSSNSVGISLIKNIWTDSIELKIIFPIDFLEDLEIERPILNIEEITKTYRINQEIELFNESGLFLKTKIEKIKIDFWCENDGGIQFRPESNIFIKKSEFIKAEKTDNYGTFSFVIANRNEKFESINSDGINTNAYKIGRIDSNGKVNAFLWTEFDESNNCSNGLDSLLLLNVNGRNFKMTCCGP